MADILPVYASSYIGKGQFLAEKLVKVFTEQGKTLALAESCTAGMTADLIARIPGASLVLWGSFVCYTNNAKHKMLGISEQLIQSKGAVSPEIAVSMAEAALELSRASFTVSVTGLAGPSGDGINPVGTVFMGTALMDKGTVFSHVNGYLFMQENGILDRNHIREAASVLLISEILKKAGNF